MLCNGKTTGHARYHPLQFSGKSTFLMEWKLNEHIKQMARTPRRLWRLLSSFHMIGVSLCRSRRHEWFRSSNGGKDWSEEVRATEKMQMLGFNRSAFGFDCRFLAEWMKKSSGMLTKFLEAQECSFLRASSNDIVVAGLTPYLEPVY